MLWSHNPDTQICFYFKAIGFPILLRLFHTEIAGNNKLNSLSCHHINYSKSVGKFFWKQLTVYATSQSHITHFKCIWCNNFQIHGAVAQRNENARYRIISLEHNTLSCCLILIATTPFASQYKFTITVNDIISFVLACLKVVDYKTLGIQRTSKFKKNIRLL